MLAGESIFSPLLFIELEGEGQQKGNSIFRK
jgi:hypothetical protein